MPGLNSENSTSRFQESMRSSDGYSSSEDDIPGDESCCEGQLRDSAFYTNEKIEDAVKHISSQAFQHFSKATRSSAPPDELDHFKCPFYASNPEKYRKCLARHDLRSVESVIRHMQRHHKQPPYCPRCSKTFETVAECDTHIIKQKCKTEPLMIPDGINDYQQRGLKSTPKKRDYHQWPTKRRWEHIYKLVFRETQSCPSAYLDTNEMTVLQARDFWKAHGGKYITEYFQAQSGLEMEDAQAMLYNACLRALVEHVVDQSLMVSGTGWIKCIKALQNYLFSFFIPWR
ncbi:hypothetical protein FOXG_22412 [Fusarium oxysporum f. sp. lycopersici 4287]|uniref:C2H2-type domain-containing protein n=1 Tax=Fusarium oxysporum f. sp. lycopersici (strain 4287 / CBS 123668 / FGSC 9935 / NRRL 34936) TaxID=426428 RepID=A0A0J9V0U4_FUSO4|nr:hypothetical protein FOXG_19463 [Fusarium oxysporum f. sp. lycopersici 4287]XP_018256630.1 hypothetical protein FOXG_22294 [Fusarium oxysporum f. sp. lycopersici 4287]XP_018256930.1 hypothetical protein FOXG_22412 [Fusarium oxysporum f. sp. lycopersici 4287]KAJ9412371.1 hypothetical protein QL093DRAFT_2552347 [Fusarium oxysporum]KNB04940.1 hypothetical protein FOXG_19463 [Fusarium oxysporum f. sp. lycopersici 4287]KNB18585.1 hypothetical protein FOXG_22294 [Fusarium oxysporum f. sp. lycoper